MKIALARRQHTPADMADARRLHNDGWSVTDIQRILAADGVLVARATVLYWVDEEAYAAHLQQDTRSKSLRRARQSGGVLRTKPKTLEFRMIRLRALVEAGLSMRAAAVVLAFDGLGEMLTDDEVRHALRAGRPPRKWRQEAAA